MNLVEMSRDTLKNNTAASHIESSWFEFDRRCNVYTVFEETPEYYEWTIDDIRQMDKVRKSGLPIEDLAYMFGRSTEEIAMAIFDREVLGKKIRVDKDNIDAQKGIYYLFDLNPDFCHWHLKEVLLFDEVYKEAYKQKNPIQTLSEMFGRTTEEVALLIMDRAIKDKI